MGKLTKTHVRKYTIVTSDIPCLLLTPPSMYLSHWAVCYIAAISKKERHVRRTMEFYVHLKQQCAAFG